MAPFKVLIAGGSVAGMALANMLERYGIDYELLEKHATIAPQLGASIAIVAHGSRILEQLGCWDTIEAMSTPVNKMTITDPEGRRLAHHSKFGDQMEELYVPGT
jgi:2-polyprenyl-6-methoxyphenol hydroxylase-like FAD-dependent oxidoreductase